MKIELNIQLMTFNHLPSTIGICVTGAKPPRNDERLIDFVHEIFPHFPKKVRDEISRTRKCEVKINRNNDPERPDDELFLQYELPFKVTKSLCDKFVPCAYRFILSYYNLS